VDQLKDVPIVDRPVRRYGQSYVAKLRNTPEGFWVRVETRGRQLRLHRFDAPKYRCTRWPLLDGITRLVERYGMSWSELFFIASQSPGSLIEAVRLAEQNDPAPSRWRGKPHDDATAILLTVRGAQPAG
jgi:hypothetical protein